jgi:hypothetical protein
MLQERMKGMKFFCEKKKPKKTGMLLLFPILPTVLLSFAKRLKSVSAPVAALSSVLAPLCDRCVFVCVCLSVYLSVCLVCLVQKNYSN